MDLSRFIEAQEPIYADALAELRAGQKRFHWIWFVLPQLRGLGRSEMAHRYGLVDAKEAKAYLAHPVLGARLRECVAALLTHPGKSAHAIMGSPDDLKLHSSLTLFNAVAAADDPLWRDALDQFFGGQLDEATLRLLSDLRI